MLWIVPLVSFVLPLRADVQLTMNARQTLGSDRVVEREVARGDVLATGDEISISVVADEDAYLYVIAIGSSGDAKLIFPFSGGSDAALTEASLEREVPGEGEFLPLDDRVGTETVFAVATERPIAKMSELLVSLESASSPSEALTLLEGTSAQVEQITFEHTATHTAATSAQTPTPAAVVPDTQTVVGAGAGTKRDWLFGGSDATGPASNTGENSSLGSSVGSESLAGRVLERTPRAPSVSTEQDETPTTAAVAPPVAERSRGDNPFGNETEPGVLALAGSRISALLGPSASSGTGLKQGQEGNVAAPTSTDENATAPSLTNDPSGATVMVVTGGTIGTGVVVAPDGYIVTTWHGVEGGSSINVVFKERDGVNPDRGNIRAARLVSHSELEDLALLQVEGSESVLSQAAIADGLSSEPDGLRLIAHDASQRWFSEPVTFAERLSHHQWQSRGRSSHRADGYRLSAGRLPEFAGGAVFNRADQLVGFMVYASDGQLFAIDSDTLRQFVARGALAAN